MTDREDIQGLRDDVKSLTVKVETYATIVAAHVNEQKATNDSVRRQLDGHAEELRKLNEWRAVKDATTPDRLIDGDELDQRFQGIDEDLCGIRGALDGIGKQLAKWAGVAVGGLAVLEIGFQLLRMRWGG
ncbi:MAG: hypothetical protein AAGE65_03530 [Planctomycetota bacterium]